MIEYFKRGDWAKEIATVWDVAGFSITPTYRKQEIGFRPYGKRIIAYAAAGSGSVSVGGGGRRGGRLDGVASRMIMAARRAASEINLS